MGNGFIKTCKKCNTENSIYYGVGMMDWPEYYTKDKYKNLIKLGEEEKLYNMDKLLQFVNLEKVSLKDNYGHDAYICNNCHLIHNKFRYTLVSANNKVFHPKYKCDYCGKFLRLKKKSEDYKMKCKNCGSEEFKKETMYMNWD